MEIEKFLVFSGLAWTVRADSTTGPHQRFCGAPAPAGAAVPTPPLSWAPCIVCPPPAFFPSVFLAGRLLSLQPSQLLTRNQEVCAQVTGVHERAAWKAVGRASFSSFPFSSRPRFLSRARVCAG